jgi:hypothetical protein
MVDVVEGKRRNCANHDVPFVVLALLDDSLGVLMSQRIRWEIPRGRYDEHSSKFSLSMKPKFNRPVGEINHF